MAPRHPSSVTGTLCPQCGEAISSHAPERLCPRCLLAAALTAPQDLIADADEQTPGADQQDEPEFDCPQLGLGGTAAHSALRRSIDFAAVALEYQCAPIDPTLSLDAVFNRSWAINILELVLRRVRQDWVPAGGADEFDRLKYALVADSTADGSEAAGEDGSVSARPLSPVSLLRRNFHQRLREAVTRTVVHPDEVDDEIWELFRALQS